GHADQRAVSIFLAADELGFLLARKQLLEVLGDLRQVLDQENSFHAARVYVFDRRRSAQWAAPATRSATAMNDNPTPAVMPCQYHSGYRRIRLLSGANRKLPCGKNTSWKSKNSGSNATAAAMPITATIPAAIKEPARTRRSASPRRRARATRKTKTKRASAAAYSAPRTTARTSAMCAYSSFVKIGSGPHEIAGTDEA